MKDFGGNPNFQSTKEKKTYGKNGITIYKKSFMVKVKNYLKTLSFRANGRVPKKLKMKSSRSVFKLL